MGRERTACVECLPDHVQLAGSVDQACGDERCPLSERPLGTTECVDCRAIPGTFYDSSITREEADPSTWDAPRCQPCAPGSSSRCLIGTNPEDCLPAINECFACLAGEHQPNAGQSECAICGVPAGTRTLVFPPAFD